MIKIGQIGIGHNHAEGKMLAVRKFPHLFEVVGYAEEDETWIQKRGSLKAYEGLTRMSVPELIAKCDALLVECDVWNLTRYARQCVEAGKHIHMDKPASSNLNTNPEDTWKDRLAQYEALLNTAKEKHCVVQLGYMYRYNPAVQKCLEAIQRGELGEIYSVNAEMSTFHSPEYRSWLSRFPGGIMYILGSHLVDLIIYMLGEPVNITSYFRHTGLDGVDCADNNLAVLEYEKALARIFVSSVEVNGWGRRQLMVAGSKGTINIVPLENTVSMTYTDTSIANFPYADLKQSVDVQDVPIDNRYDQMMLDFYDYIKGTKKNPYTYQHDYLVQKVLCEITGGDI